MDTDRLFKDLANSEEIRDVPIMYVARVAVTLLKLLQGNRYNYIFIGERDELL